MTALATLLFLGLLSACSQVPVDTDDPNVNDDKKKDEWVYKPDIANQDRMASGGFFSAPPSGTSVMNSAAMAPSAMMDMAMEESFEGDDLGFAVGGANDIENFRENIENGYLPLFTDITYEGLFYDYFFDTGQVRECEKLFCPSYDYAVSNDPFSEEEEYYLQVGLNSGLKESDFERKKLNLVVVLDISGSMDSAFDSYYYDGPEEIGFFDEPIEEDEDAGKSKMEIANKAVVSLLDHLNEEDRFGMVVFDDQAYLAKSMLSVGETDMDALKENILDLESEGGTNMEAGMRKGTDLFDEYLKVDQEEYENRIIFITDAMPNTGRTDEDSLLGMTEENAENKISTTFIGVGVDFNTELVESISKVRGANYYSVHSAREFKTRMDDEFEFMVTPLVFDLLLSLDAPGFEIEKVYGSPLADESTGEIMKVNTLFPSKTEGGEMKGGIVILKLKKIGDETSVTLKTSYEDRLGEKGGDEAKINLADAKADYYGNDGLRKGILLVRYASLMKNWIHDEREAKLEDRPVEPRMSDEMGIILPPEFPDLGQWERRSVDLQVSEDYKEMMGEFKNYFEDEMEEIGDDALEQEVEILEELIEG